MTDETIASAKADIESTEDSRNEVIRLSWEEWQAGRTAKRETLRKLGQDAPSRRPFGHDDRLRVAFGGSRAPSFAS